MSQSWKNNNREGSFTVSLIWSPGTSVLFCLIPLPWRWHSWQVLKLALRPAVGMLGLKCRRGALNSSPLIVYRDPSSLPKQTILDTFLTTCHDFCPEHDCRWGDDCRVTHYDLFFPPRRDTTVWRLLACQCVLLCLSDKLQIYFWNVTERTNPTLNVFSQ